MKSTLVRIFLIMLIATLVVAVSSGFISQMLTVFMARSMSIETYAAVSFVVNIIMLLLNAGILGVILAILARPFRHDGTFNQVLWSGIGGSIVARFLLPLFSYFVYANVVGGFGDVLSLPVYYVAVLVGTIFYTVFFVIAVYIVVQLFYKLCGDGRKAKAKD